MQKRGLLVLGASLVLILAAALLVHMFWPKNILPTGLIFDDEFNGTTLNANTWATCYPTYSVRYRGCSNFGNWESEWYKKTQVTVGQGNLILSARQQDTAGLSPGGYAQNYPYTSGMVTTGALSTQKAASWSHTYGYYEARMMTPYGDGVWPAFWLIPADYSWPPEIDVMEILGNTPNRVLMTYFWKGQNGTAAKDSASDVFSQNLSNGWHTYGLNWQPGLLAWYIDGKLIRQVKSSHVPAQPMFLVLNLAVGGTLPGAPDQTTPTRMQMLVDYVRVYAQKPRTP